MNKYIWYSLVGIIILAPVFATIIFLRICGERIVERVSGFEKYKDFGGFKIYCPKDVDIDFYAAEAKKFLDILFAYPGKKLSLKPPLRRIHIYLCKDEKHFQAHATSDFKRDLVYNSGFYNPVANKIAIILSYDQNINLQAIRHELVHAILEGSAPNSQMSPWLHEGLASLLESLEVENHQWRCYPSKQAVVLAEKVVEFISIEHLLKAAHNEFTGKYNFLYYAGSQLLVHFLLTQTPEPFYQYYNEELKPGTCIPGTFESIFGDLQQLNQRWREFVLKLKNTY